MGYIRFFILSILALFVTQAIRAGLASRGGKVPVGGPARRPMIRCAGCGIYILKDRALPSADGSSLYCSPACAGR